MAANLFSFQCTGEDDAGIDEELARQLNLQFPDAYLFHETMEKMALAKKQAAGSAFCVLPFCHTVEGEALGGRIRYGDAQIGPRARERICSTPEDVLSLPSMEFSSGRIGQVLTACQSLSRRGEPVVLNMSGPLTILNVLMETSDVLTLLMEDSASADAVFDFLKQQLLRYTEQAALAGVSVISFADPIGGADIVGPHVAAAFAQRFTLPFLQAAGPLLTRYNRDAARSQKTLLFLCPKVCQTLADTGAVRWERAVPFPSAAPAETEEGRRWGIASSGNRGFIQRILREIAADDSIIGGSCIKSLLNASNCAPCFVLK